MLGKRSRRLGIIGFGAVTAEVLRALHARDETGAVLGILVKTEQRTGPASIAPGPWPLLTDIQELLRKQPDCIVEAAGHDAIRCFGATILGRGIDLVSVSTGALADRSVAAALARSANGDTELWIPSGAVAGIDGLLASRRAGFKSVTYTSLKPPAAWVGTPAEEAMKPERISARTIFFAGSARQAALQYPRNANVAATIALASLGLDKTRALLGSEPGLDGPVGIIEADGPLGSLRVEMRQQPTAHNPKSSAQTGHSIVSAIYDGMCFRALPLLRADLLEGGNSL